VKGRIPILSPLAVANASAHCVH